MTIMRQNIYPGWMDVLTRMEDCRTFRTGLWLSVASLWWNEASCHLDSPEDWQGDHRSIDFGYYNIKRLWLYWKWFSDFSSCLGVISTKLLSLITSSTHYQCQDFLCLFQVRLWGTHCAYMWLTMRMGKGISVAYCW